MQGSSFRIPHRQSNALPSACGKTPWASVSADFFGFFAAASCKNAVISGVCKPDKQFNFTANFSLGAVETSLDSCIIGMPDSPYSVNCTSPVISYIGFRSCSKVTSHTWRTPFKDFGKSAHSSAVSAGAGGRIVCPNAPSSLYAPPSVPCFGAAEPPAQISTISQAILPFSKKPPLCGCIAVISQSVITCTPRFCASAQRISRTDEACPETGYTRPMASVLQSSPISRKNAMFSRGEKRVSAAAAKSRSPKYAVGSACSLVRLHRPLPVANSFFKGFCSFS